MKKTLSLMLALAMVFALVLVAAPAAEAAEICDHTSHDGWTEWSATKVPSNDLLELMEFDGIEKVRDKVEQGQTLMNQLMMMQEQMNKLGMIVYRLTGQDVVGLAQGGVQVAQGGPQAQGGIPAGKSEGLARAHEEGKKATQTSYGERLAERARPSMEEQK